MKYISGTTCTTDAACEKKKYLASFAVSQCYMRLLLQNFILISFLFFVPLNVNADTPTVKRLVDNGVNLLMKQKPYEAILVLKQVLLLSPEHPEAHFRYGQALLQQRKAKESLIYIQKATEYDPRNVRYSLYLAQFYEKQGDLKKAENEYQRIIDTGTRDPRIKEVEKLLSLATGRKLAQNNELSAALLIFNGLLLEYPDDPQVLFNIGNAYMLLDRLQEAETIFTRLLTINPNSEIVNMNLATIYEKTNRPQEAMHHLKVIIDLRKRNDMYKEASVMYHIINGREKLKIQDWQAALKSFQIVVDLDPSRTEAFFNISMANLQLGNTLMAERGFLSVLKVAPDNFVARLNLAQMYFNLGRIEQSQEQLKYIIENDKSGRFSQQAKIRLNAIHTLLADRALESGDVETSLQQYQKALDFFSANVKASFNRGMIFIQQKKWAEARLEFEEVIRHDAKNLRGRTNLANVYEQLNKFSKAADQYEIIMEIDKDSQEAKYAASRWKNTKARGLWAEGRLSEAEAIFEEIVTEQPRNIQALTFLGVIQSSKGKLKEATNSYQRVLDFAPTNYAVKLLLGKVFEQLGLDSLAANEYRSIIFAGGRVPQIPEAELRLAAVESRLSGFSNSLSYNFAYDSNLNLDDDLPVEEVRSDLALSFIYAMKTTDKLSFRLSWSPTYSNYHLNQTDYFRSLIQSNVQYGPPEKNWTGSFMRQDQDNLVNDTKLSKVTSVLVGQNRKLFLNPLLNLAPKGFENAKIASSGNASFGLRHIASFSNTPIESLTATFSLSLFQNLRWGVGTNLSYSLDVYRNLRAVEEIRSAEIEVETNALTGLEETKVADEVETYNSNDYEYNSHSVRVNLRKALAPGIVGNIGFAGIYTAYVNPDSGAIIRNKQSKRANLTLSATARINYYFFKDMSFFVSGNFTQNLSSLPVGLSSGLSGDDAVASFQSTSLGDYTRYTAEGGFRMDF